MAIINILKKKALRVMDKIRYYKFCNEFYNKFPNNLGITPMNIFNLDYVSIGKGTYGELYILMYPNITIHDSLKVQIGNYVSIAENVKFFLNADHSTNTISTYPFKTLILGEPEHKYSKGTSSKGSIIINDDVWIGHSSMIMSGVTIGQGAIIAAGAIVTKDVEPYSIVGGVPAKLIKYRHDKKIRDKLLQINYSCLTDEIIANNKDKLYEKVTLDNIDELISFLPKK